MFAPHAPLWAVTYHAFQTSSHGKYRLMMKRSSPDLPTEEEAAAKALLDLGLPSERKEETSKEPPKKKRRAALTPEEAEKLKKLIAEVEEMYGDVPKKRKTSIALVKEWEMKQKLKAEKQKLAMIKKQRKTEQKEKEVREANILKQLIVDVESNYGVKIPKVRRKTIELVKAWVEEQEMNAEKKRNLENYIVKVEKKYKK